MFFLIASIILNSWLTLAFKLNARWNISNFQAIIFNYITCVVTGSLFNGRFPVDAHAITAGWFPWAVAMGCVFVTTFNLVGLTTEKLGVSVASVSYKLSLCIPFVFSIFLYQEPVTWLQVAGIVLALVAVYLTVRKKEDDPVRRNLKLAVLLPAILFIGSGLLDTMIKYCEQRFLNPANSNDFLVTAFGSAATLGLLVLLALLATGKQVLQYKAILSGICIGIPNYFSIWCLVAVLRKFPGSSSAIIPINNMGILVFSAVAATLFFRERISVLNWAGIGLALVAISLIAFG